MFLAALLGGCTSYPPVSPESKTEPMPKVYEVQEVYPGWVTNPDVGGHTGVVGYARPQGSEMRQRQTALIVAKARLSERMNVKVSSLAVSRLSDVNGDVSREYHDQSVQTSSNRIKGVVVRDEYRDKAGVLYLWLTVD